MAGTTPLSLVQQFDSTGAPLAGGLLYFYVAGTVGALQNAYQDFGLTVPLANPVTLDQTGRVPQHWLADGLIHIRLTDAQGNPQVDTTMQVLGPSSGGGGGGTVDPTAILSTGDMKARYGTGPISGWVRCNNLTIGNATSGATERANNDTQSLFVYLWNTDPNLVVSGGRGASALVDFNANKTIATPDWRGRAFVALDDMGNSPAGRLTATYFGTSAIVLGAAGGSQNQNIGIANINPFNFTPSVNAYNLSIGLQGGYFTGGSPLTTAAADGVNNGGLNPLPVSGSITMNPVNLGSGTAFGIVMPAMLATFYIKL